MQINRRLRSKCMQAMICLLSGLLACTERKESNDTHRAVINEAALNRQYEAINDSCITLLQTGDLVLRRGRDLVSKLFLQLNAYDQSYSHAGIVLIENGYPFVYHCINDPARPGTGMHRDSVSRFVAADEQEAWAIVRYDLKAPEQDSVASVTKQLYESRPAFDRRFDLSSDQQLYCTELVYKVYCRATNDTAYLPLTRKQDKIYIGVDNLYMNEHAQTICRVLYK